MENERIGAKPKTAAAIITEMESLSQTAMAWIFGISSRAFRDRRGVPRNEDGSYNARSVIQWHVEQLQPVDAEPMLSGPDSPALERFREARAKLAELELSVRRGQLVDLEEFNGWFDLEIAGPLRKNLQKLQRKHGKEAFELISNGLQQAVDRVAKRGES